ncbi:hypothetical protein I4F81_003675 [Pyropia yezoensis]|uniref:Uncharacterized protein n=1 Tax=Pyropia yezoensis TaxID=2788 RepID=A0ACC3BST4_PYRYE|nr:hypothetical protein I4F81_003675 [Neopyropia yezoensis]
MSMGTFKSAPPPRYPSSLRIEKVFIGAAPAYAIVTTHAATPAAGCQWLLGSYQRKPRAGMAFHLGRGVLLAREVTALGHCPFENSPISSKNDKRSLPAALVCTRRWTHAQCHDYAAR